MPPNLLRSANGNGEQTERKQRNLQWSSIASLVERQLADFPRNHCAPQVNFDFCPDCRKLAGHVGHSYNFFAGSAKMSLRSPCQQVRRQSEPEILRTMRRPSSNSPTRAILSPTERVCSRAAFPMNSGLLNFTANSRPAVEDRWTH